VLSAEIFVVLSAVQSETSSATGETTGTSPNKSDKATESIPSLPLNLSAKVSGWLAEICTLDQVNHTLLQSLRC